MVGPVAKLKATMELHLAARTNKHLAIAHNIAIDHVSLDALIKRLQVEIMDMHARDISVRRAGLIDTSFLE